MITMPFGQHKGRAIGDDRMDDSYFRWLIETTDGRVTDEMRDAALLELTWRNSREVTHEIEADYLIQVPIAYAGLDPRLHAEILGRVCA